jgi:hypothetical protein
LEGGSKVVYGKSVLLFLYISGLVGCSTNPNYHKAANCGVMTPICVAAVAVEDALVGVKNESQKCSQMTGEQRERCEAQVATFSKHIRKSFDKDNNKER